jgi:hypothetical protein
MLADSWFLIFQIAKVGVCCFGAYALLVALMLVTP